MIIPKITTTKQNFNAFISWKNNSDENLSNQEIRTLEHIRTVLNNKQSKHINIYGEIACGDEREPDVKLVRFKTSPLLGDIIEIRKQAGRANASPKDYERNSLWFPLNNNLEWEAIKYLNRQINYIRYCTKNADHSSNLVTHKKH